MLRQPNRVQLRAADTEVVDAEYDTNASVVARRGVGTRPPQAKPVRHRYRRRSTFALAPGPPAYVLWVALGRGRPPGVGGLARQRRRDGGRWVREIVLAGQRM